jgi:hypothetical protein
MVREDIHGVSVRKSVKIQPIRGPEVHENGPL